MKLTARLAYSQLKINRKRTIWTLAGIALSAAMLTAVCGFVASARLAVKTAFGIDSYSAALTAAMTALGLLLGAIIVFASVVVASNAFRVSAGERTRQFGILKSVGATKRQIAQMIVYEGMFLSAIAIPVGWVLGLFVEFAGTLVVTDLLNMLNRDGALTVEMSMPFVVTLPMFAVSIATSFGTVWLSAWLPARKAAKITAIDAIRAADEVKLKRGEVKTSKLTQMLFGFEGSLAAKSLRRSRRNFRATVVSLTISVVLFIIAGSFGGMMGKMTDLYFPNIDATAVGQFLTSIKFIYEGDSTVGKLDAMTIDSATAERITQKLAEYPGADIFGVGSFSHYSAVLPPGFVSEAPGDFRNAEQGGYTESDASSTALITVDAEHYAAFCEAAGVPLGSNILVNRRVERAENGKRRDYAPFNFPEAAGRSIALSLGGAEQLSVVITGELTGADVPAEIVYMAYADFSVIVPECEASQYNWFTNVPDAAGFAAYAESVIRDLSPKGREDLSVRAGCANIAEQTAILKRMADVAMFFVYGFVGMLTLIALTNVISTIGANVRARSGEFAVLQSVGMTKSGLARMLNLESVLCSARSLLYGLPLGIAGSYAAYRAIGLAAEFDFSFPWLAVPECCFGVFAVTWVSMRYAASRLKAASIVGAIRGNE